MKVTYVTIYDANDVQHWSGSGYHIARALKFQNLDVDLIGPLGSPKVTWPVFKAKGLLYNRILRKRYCRAHDVAFARHYARKIEKSLSQRGAGDIIFSPWSIPIAFLNTDRPIAYWHDATHAGLFDFYPDYTGMCRRSIRDGHLIEHTALKRSCAAIFSSDWAARSAIEDYNADPKKVHVVPFGANLENPPSPGQVGDAIRARSKNTCKLLFIGVDWFRKGGDLALQVAEKLNRIGLRTELTIVGCNPFTSENKPPFVRCEGFLSKQNPVHLKRIEQLLAESHFLLVPSLAEAFGIVYCEANAYGVPSLARAVGGVPTVIKDGQNGFLFPVEAEAIDYVQIIERYFQRYENYIDLALSSLNEYQQRLNWQVAGKRVRQILLEATAGGARKQNIPAGR
ncbi:MAG TPA: glycosyltransferase family 4 protein [Opitutales bacterium]|nr:glycosyltransferase family 4 protein [Opitutales bacterium]